MFDAPTKQMNGGVTPRRGKKPKYAKQRSVQRCPFVASAEITDLASNTKLSARTSELGVGGCYIDALNPFPEESLVRVRIVRDDGAFEVAAKVVYMHNGFGMGLAFTDIPQDQRSILETWLAEIVMQLKPTP